MFEHNKRNQRKLRRKENKKKKLRALLEISSLNDQDRKKSSSQNSACNDISNGVTHQKGQKSPEEPNPKRMKREYLLYPLNGTENSQNEVYVKKDRSNLTVEQNNELKRLLYLRRQMRKERAFLELNKVGEAAALSLPESQRVPLPFDDFQHFIITSLLAHMGTKGPSRWISCKKHEKLERRIFMIIEGAGLKEYLDKQGDLPTLSQFQKQLEVITPLQYGGDLINEFALVTLTNSQKEKLASEYGSLREAFKTGDIFNTFKTIFPITAKKSSTTEDKMSIRTPDKFSRTELLLTPWDMIEENFPLPLTGEIGKRYSEFVFTRDNYSEVTANSPMWALDCEMCLTTVGSELTRICIVDEDSNIVYETLVKPYNPIKNYLTKFSGITPTMMKPVKTRLEDVQADIREICPPDLILIGQSINMDLTAMKMMHPYIIDTSIIFNLSGTRPRKTKLRILVEEFLSLRIQTDDILGHSPIEDALAAMKLVQAKLCHSLSWGNAVMSGPRSEEESAAARLLLETREAAGMARLPFSGSKRLSWPQLTNKQRDRGRDLQRVPQKSSASDHSPKYENVCASSLFSHLVRYNKNAMFVAKPNDLDRWSPYFGKVNERFHTEALNTNRGIVKYARDHTPDNGTGIAYISLAGQHPAEAIVKADKLTNKMMKCTKRNTLYSVLLAGNTINPGNGMLLVHLAREKIPTIPDNYMF